MLIIWVPYYILIRLLLKIYENVCTCYIFRDSVDYGLFNFKLILCLIVSSDNPTVSEVVSYSAS